MQRVISLGLHWGTFKPGPSKIWLWIEKTCWKATWTIGHYVGGALEYFFRLTLESSKVSLVEIAIAHGTQKILTTNLWYLVEVGLRAQNAIWNFKAPHGIISSTFTIIKKILATTFFSRTFTIKKISCCLLFTHLHNKKKFLAAFFSQPLNYCDNQ